MLLFTFIQSGKSSTRLAKARQHGTLKKMRAGKYQRSIPAPKDKTSMSSKTTSKSKRSSKKEPKNDRNIRKDRMMKLKLPMKRVTRTTAKE